MSATLTSSMSANTTKGFHWHPYEGKMYLAVTKAWFGLVGREQRRAHPLEPYVFGRRFMHSVTIRPVEPQIVALTCAKLACRYPRHSADPEPMPLAGPPTALYDPLSAWWCACEGSDEFGVHYDELAGGVLEFLSVDSWKQRPSQGYRRP